MTSGVQNIVERITEEVKLFPREWDGREAILSMQQAGYPHWKQMEWIGFYFQFLCDTRLSQVMDIPGPRYGRSEFDGFAEILWDFKAHPDKNAKGKENKKVIVNDREAIESALTEFGAAGLILAIGEATYNDHDRTFQMWHKELKGGLSEYEKERIGRAAPSRLRKTAFRLKEIRLILLDVEHVATLPSFQKGFRNSDGSPRREKVLLDIEHIASVVVVPFV